ncbi:unnamed protein product [Urochloa decumbens]|uniref:WIYLD domain-containing protein n=1 Tax=Urochloa decumbens TaxID=240449 RepID=A0ABC9FQM9_9POAL
MGRPKKGERRIDAAIDHLAQLGFPKPRIRKTINDLLKVYGKDGWMFLEEGSYEVVRDQLLDEQEQLEKQAAAAAAATAAADEASLENDMEVSEAMHSEAPSEPRSALEPQASPDSSFPQGHVLPLPPAARLRPPCRGWISEESDTESEIEDEEMISDAPRLSISPKRDILNPARTLPSKRKRPTRWDVRPNGV